MPLHLIKLAVGADDIDAIKTYQQRRAQTRPDGTTAVPVFTRMVPKRGTDVTDGGSLYWVVRGSIACRQRVLDIDTGTDDEGRAYCIISVDPTLVPTVPTGQRPFQGWRYLEAEKAPADLSDAGGAGEELPAHLAAELRSLGLL